VVLFSKTKLYCFFTVKLKHFTSVTLITFLGSTYGLTASIPAKAFELTPYKATYKAKIKGFTTNLSRELEQEKDGSWQLTNKATIFFADFKERSQFLIKGKQVIPSSYNYRDESLRYDWPEKKVLAVSGGKKKVLTLRENMLDKLSYLPQIRIDFLSGELKEKKYRLIDGIKQKSYTVSRIREERISTPIGQYDTVVLEQIRGESSKTRIWLDKNNRGLIVKLEKFNEDKLTYSLDLIKQK